MPFRPLVYNLASAWLAWVSDGICSFCLSVTENNDDRIACIVGGGDTHDTTGSNTP